MKRRLPWILALVALAIVLGVWRTRGGASDDAPSSRAATAHAPAAGSAARRVAATPRPDPQTLGRGSLAGTITDDATRAPIAGAQVCAYGTSNVLASELLKQPICTLADAQGRYTIANLLPAGYRVGASARTYRPAIHHPAGDRKRVVVYLVANAAQTGIDIALRPGGVEVTGTVVDLTGGVVAKARVWQGTGDDQVMAATEADDEGRFSVWVAPDYIVLSATADGYDEATKWVDAPAQHVELVLTPESSLAGTVVDAASGQPIEGARVQLGDWTGSDFTFTDAQGAFRITKLAPSRYVVVAHTDRGYGRSEGSALVGLGQHVTGVVVKLFPAARFTAKVVIAATKQPCPEPEAMLLDKAHDRYLTLRRDPDGTLWAEGVLPGTYEPSVGCEGYQPREKYDRITIADKDVTDVVWEVDAGATIRGRVLTRAGTPVEDARVWARTVGGAGRERTGWGDDTSDRDGRYELAGQKPGVYRIEVASDHGAAPKDGYKVEVAAGATIDKDLVLDDVGTIKGTVVDANGTPVAHVSANAVLVSGGGRGWQQRDVDDAGAFTLEGLRPGEYRVIARRTWSDALKKPGTTDDAKQGEKVTVKANQTATVRIVVEAPAGAIRGTVVDTAGQPVGDAFISAVRESDAAGAQKSNVSETRWQWEDKPVLTAVDGTFVVDKLAPGAYTVRAYRRGGGEAVAEHVPVGGSAKLQIKPTGAIRGVATLAGGAPGALTDLQVTVNDRKTGFWREESFYMTEGRFFVEDLPQGHFDLTVAAGGNRKTIELDLAEGETRSGVGVQLEGATTLHGRLVEQGTTRPVPGVRMSAAPIIGAGGWGWGGDVDASVTDETGAFTIENAPRGRVRVRGFPKDWSDSAYAMVDLLREPSADGDLGDIPILKRRVKRGDAVGELGVHFADQPEDTLPDQRELKVSWIDPNGPAAKTELKVGDVVVAIDGTDVAGANNTLAWTLMRAAPGTKLALGLARGATVTLVLAAP